MPVHQRWWRCRAQPRNERWVGGDGEGERASGAHVGRRGRVRMHDDDAGNGIASNHDMMTGVHVGDKQTTEREEEREREGGRERERER